MSKHSLSELEEEVSRLDRQLEETKKLVQIKLQDEAFDLYKPLNGLQVKCRKSGHKWKEIKYGDKKMTKKISRCDIYYLVQVIDHDGQAFEV